MRWHELGYIGGFPEELALLFEVEPVVVPEVPDPPELTELMKEKLLTKTASVARSHSAGWNIANACYRSYCGSQSNQYFGRLGTILALRCLLYYLLLVLCLA